MKTTIEILKEARELIAKEGGWFQGYYAANTQGEDREALDPEAVCFCTLGALSKAARGDFWNRKAAARSLADVMGDYPVKFNDAPGRTQAEVVAKFDEAIAAEEAKAVAA